MFGKIKEIEVENSESWENKIFLTFDIDWCSDIVLSYTLDILEKYNIKATFFVTHKTKLLERMRCNPNIELGIHPNFNPLLNADFRYGKNMNEVIEYYKKIVPDTVSVRSHSLTSHSNLSKLFQQHGFLYECNQLIPENSQIVLRPYTHWEDNLTIVPHFWEDDVHCIYQDKWELSKYINYRGIKVFDFHPIHLFLNSDELERYDNARNFFHNEKLIDFINQEEIGTHSFLIELIEEDLKNKKVTGDWNG